jgi:hypothetical protein
LHASRKDSDAHPIVAENSSDGIKKSKAWCKIQVILFGLDGASFNLIEPWVQEGRLPASGRVLREEKGRC